MNKKFTLYVFHDRAPYPRRLTISAKSVAVVVLVLLASILSAAFVFRDYSGLRSAKEKARAMEKLVAFQQKKIAGQSATIQNQEKELAGQRARMEDVARQLNVVRDRLTTLGEFEKKIRIITDIDNREIRHTHLGVGGPETRDFSRTLSLSVPHKDLFENVNEMAAELSSASSEQEAQFMILLKRLEDQQKELAKTTPSICPVKGEVSSVFGYRESPFSGEWEFHKGLDLAAPSGTPVVAPAAGVISFAGRRGGYGNAICIDHGKGVETRFGHLSAILKKEGDKVRKGDVIGLVGNTGSSTGSHLHYEVRLNNVPVNPVKYIKAG